MLHYSRIEMAVWGWVAAGKEPQTRQVRQRLVLASA